MAMQCQEVETPPETMMGAINSGEVELVHDEVLAIIAKESEQRAKDDLAKQADGGDDHEGEGLEAKLQKASVGSFAARGSLGVQFQRDEAGANSDEYKKMTGHKEKAEFRRRWAATRLEKVVQSREREDEWKKVDTTKGDMVSIKELIKREGADAKKYIEKCAALGPPWIFYDPMWERYECMVMTRSHQDIFTKAWRLRCSRMNPNLEEQPPTKKVVVTAKDIYTYIYIYIYIHTYG